MSHFLMFGLCVDCDKTRGLTQQGKCENCNSDAVMIRRPKAVPGVSVIEELMELEKMFRFGESR